MAACSAFAGTSRRLKARDATRGRYRAGLASLHYIRGRVRLLFEYPDFIENILNLAIIGLGIFSFIAMVVVFQAAVAAKEYYERENLTYRTRPTQFDRQRSASGDGR